MSNLRQLIKEHLLLEKRIAQLMSSFKIQYSFEVDRTTHAYHRKTRTGISDYNEKEISNSEIKYIVELSLRDIAEKIAQHNIIDDDNCEFTMSFSKYLKIYDQFKTNIALEDINTNDPLEVVSIINIRNLQFIDNMFTCNILLEQMKVDKDTRIVGYSIMESEPSFSISIQGDESSDSLLMDEYYSSKI